MLLVMTVLLVAAVVRLLRLPFRLLHRHLLRRLLPRFRRFRLLRRRRTRSRRSRRR